MRAWQASGDPHLFKVIISPEFGERLDLRSSTARWVAAVERDLGTKLQWVAVEHHNTSNPHVHIAIRGVDDCGQALKIDPGYIKSGSRVRAQEIATRDIGTRTPADMRLAAERQVMQQRFTDLDRAVLKRANSSTTVTFEGPIPRSGAARDMRLAQIRRLAQLTRMGLAERTGTVTWSLNPSLEQVLRLMQSSQDRQKIRSQHRQMISDANAPLVMTDLGAAGDRVSGCLVGTGLDEVTNRSYMLVEGFDGKVHYVVQPPRMEKLRHEGAVAIGDFVAIEAFPRTDLAGIQKIGIRVEAYGSQISPKLLDRELKKGAVQPGLQVPAGSVAGVFQAAAAIRKRELDKGKRL